MKLFALALVTVLLLTTFSCKSTTDSNINEKIERVSLDGPEIFEYQTGISGDEELATVIQEPDHYEISKIVRDSTTNWEAVYRYKPENGFKGTDEAEIKIGTGSDGASPNTDFELIRIVFTVN